MDIGHHCKKRELSVLLMDNENDEESDGCSTKLSSSPTLETLTEV